VLLHEFSIREGSGGQGKWRGGNGLTRIIEPLTDLSMNILSERRSHAPYGGAGGGDGARGRNCIRRKGGVLINIGGKASCNLRKGDVLIIESPGGGGWGIEGEGREADDHDASAQEAKFVARANGSVAEFAATQFSV
jgi:5-oxoprolinase (ATP-hydrolysing)